MKHIYSHIFPRSRGKFFYIILSLVAGFILLSLTLSLVISMGTLNYSSAQLQSSFLPTLTQEIQELADQTSFSGNLHEISDILIRSDVLETLGEQEIISPSETLTEAEELLEYVLEETGEVPNAKRYFYFSNSNYLLGTEVSGASAWDDAPAEVTDLCSSLDYGRIGDFQNHIGISEEGSNYHIIVRTVGVDTYYVSYLTDVNYSLSETFTENLQDVQLIVYDRYGNMQVQAGDSSLLSAFTYDSLGEGDSGTLSFSYNGHYYLGAYATSASRQIRIAFFFRNSTLESQRIIRRILILSAAVLLIVCLCFACYVIWRAYHPIEKLLQDLQPEQSSDSFSLRSEHAIITEAIDSYQAEIARQKEQLQDYWLLQKMKGINTEDYSDFEDPWLKNTNDPYAITILCSDSLPAETSVEPAEWQHAVSTFLKDKYEIRSVTDGRFFLIILRLPNGDTGNLLETMKRLQAEFPAYTLSAYISNEHKQISELHLAYEEALGLCHFCMANETYGIVMSLSALGDKYNKKNSFEQNIQFLRGLLHHVSELSEEKALNAFDQIFNQIADSEDGMISEEKWPEFAFLRDSIALTLSDFTRVENVKPQIVTYCLNRIRKTRNGTELRKCLKDSIRALSSNCCSQSDGEMLFEEITAFIQENYHDCGLSASLVAEHFQISSSSVSRIFQKYNQSTFLEYIHTMRLNEAEVLLKTTELREAEIAAQVGYNNVITMIRAFRTYKNTTPSALRKEHG